MNCAGKKASVLEALVGLTRLALTNPARFQAHFPAASIILGMLKSATEPHTHKKQQNFFIIKEAAAKRGYYLLLFLLLRQHTKIYPTFVPINVPVPPKPSQKEPCICTPFEPTVPRPP